MEPKNIKAGPIVLVTIVLLKDTQFGSDKSPIAITYYHIHIVLHITTYFVKLQSVSRSKYMAAANIMKSFNPKGRMMLQL